MKKMNLIKGIQYIPEVFIVLMAIYWFLDGLLATSNINYLMLAVILFMSLLVILKNKTMALFASLLIGVGSLYMIFAVLSEYSEFPRGDANGFKLLLTGAIIFFIHFIDLYFATHKILQKKAKSATKHLTSQPINPVVLWVLF